MENVGKVKSNGAFCGQSASEKVTQGRMCIVFGASGCGKTTLVKRLLSEKSDLYAFCISHTTRQKRHNEVNGREYHFVNQETMNKLIKDGYFFETTQYSNNTYGTSFEAISQGLSGNRTLLLDIDVNGVKSFRKLKDSRFPNCLVKYVYIKVPSEKVLEERLRTRNTHTEEELKERCLISQNEIKWAESQTYFDAVIYNDVLESAYADFVKAVE